MTGGMVFGFGDTKITVSFADFILSTGNACVVGMTPLGDGDQQVLGDSFMRSAYGKPYFAVCDVEYCFAYFRKNDSCV